jgi:hypothetical protein
MTYARPVEHLVFPTFLQNHSLLRPGLDLADPRVFDRFLRFQALFSRGLVVADSDLNNNLTFHNAAQGGDGLFWTAIRTGFLRRAARADEHGNLLSQRKVSEGLMQSSRWRFDLIPVGYPAELDAALAQAEDGDPPLVWTLQRVNRVFGEKLLALLKGAARDPGRDGGQLRFIDLIADWVSERLSAGASFGAADIETALSPGRDSGHRPAWDAVWPVVLQAHTGNIPLVFGGSLPVIGLPEANDRLLPAGPEAGPEESEIKARLYAGGATEQDVRLEVRRIDSELPGLNVSMARLDELRLEDVEELREAAAPQALLDECFHAAGSGEAMAARMDALRDETIAYLERLASAGVVLTAEKQRAVLRSELWKPAGTPGAETQIVASAQFADRLVEYAMLHSIPYPGAGPQVLGCDFSWLVDLLGEEQAREFYGGDISLYWFYKRPDFRVVELLANR